MSLDTVIKDIREEAHARADEITDKAETRAQEIIDEAEADAERIHNEREAEVEQQIEQEREQTLSSAKLEANRTTQRTPRRTPRGRERVESELAAMGGDRREQLTRALLEASLDELKPRRSPCMVIVMTKHCLLNSSVSTTVPSTVGKLKSSGA
jgi:Archaeal/vacuolar-type H+-ATPase subunit E